MMTEKLLDAAKKAGENAYAPYSGFKVGAALLTEDNSIFAGCNVENASYGLTMCAERTAVFNAVSAGKRNFAELLIYTQTDIPFYPCGACRQVLSEFNPNLMIKIVWNNGEEAIPLSQLLPKQFKL